MKSYKVSIRFLCLLSFFVSVNGYGQQKPEVVITLIVDTAQLGDDPNDPKGCVLEAQPVSKVIDNSNIKDFNVLVDVGSKIIWKGITTDGDVVKILKIYYLDGDNPFKKEKLRRCLFGRKVRNKPRRTTTEGKDYVYGIKFKVKKKEKRYLDPKIRVK